MEIEYAKWLLIEFDIDYGDDLQTLNSSNYRRLDENEDETFRLFLFADLDDYKPLELIIEDAKGTKDKTILIVFHSVASYAVKRLIARHIQCGLREIEAIPPQLSHIRDDKIRQDIIALLDDEQIHDSKSIILRKHELVQNEIISRTLTMYEDLLTRYKRTQSHGIYAQGVEGHPMYLMLIKLAQLGKHESIAVMSAQLGIPVDALKILIDASRTLDDKFILSYTDDPNIADNEILVVGQDDLTKLRAAALEVSPEHMPPETVFEKSGRRTKEIDSGLLLNIFREQESNAFDQIVRVARTITNMQVTENPQDEDGTRAILLQSLSTNFAIIPTVGSRETGYYANRHNVQDARTFAQEVSAETNSRYIAIIVSTGFTERAKTIAQLEPRVILFPIWVFLKFMKTIQDRQELEPNSGVYAFDQAADILNEDGIAPFINGQVVATMFKRLTEGVISIPSIFEQTHIPIIELICGVTEADFAQRFLAGARNMAEELGAGLRITSANSIISDVPRLISTAAEGDAGVLIVNLGPKDECEIAINQALKAGKRIVTFDLRINNDDVPYIGQDDIQIGTMLAHYVANETKGNAKILYLSSHDLDPMIWRDQGWETTRHIYPNLVEISRLGKVSKDLLQDNKNDILAALIQNAEIDSIVAMWDEFAKAALAAINEANLDRNITIYSVDISDENIRLMLNSGGIWKATVAIDPYSAGRLSIRTACATLAGEEVEKFALLKPYLITYSDIHDLGIQNISQLIAARPELGDYEICWFPWMRLLKWKNQSR